MKSMAGYRGQMHNGLSRLGDLFLPSLRQAPGGVVFDHPNDRTQVLPTDTQFPKREGFNPIGLGLASLIKGLGSNAVARSSQSIEQRSTLLHPVLTSVDGERVKINLLNNLGISNYYIIEEDGDLMCVDTGGKQERPWLLAVLRKLDRPVSLVLITHCHVDHAGNADWIRGRFGAKVLCSKGERDFLSGRRMNKPQFRYQDVPPFSIPFVAHHVFTGDAQVTCQIDGTFQDPLFTNSFTFYPLPGHTPGSGVILHKETGALFVGDTVLNSHRGTWRARTGLKLPYKFWSHDYNEALERLKVLATIDFQYAFFGHGPPVTKQELLGFLKREGLLS